VYVIFVDGFVLMEILYLMLVLCVCVVCEEACYFCPKRCKNKNCGLLWL